MNHERTRNVFQACMAHVPLLNNMNLHDAEQYVEALWEAEQVPHVLPLHIYHKGDMGQPVWVAYQEVPMHRYVAH